MSEPIDAPFAAVLPALRCPVCRAGMLAAGRQLRCAAGHGFDLARQGYVNLTAGGHPGSGDTTAMVLARERFLAGGHYRRLAGAVAATAGGLVGEPAGGRAQPKGLVLDLAGGTGYFLAAVLDAAPERTGVCLDLSAAALRRAAAAHPRAVAIGADAWARLPLADRSVAVALNVFGPRNPAELERVLAARALLVTASPLPEHLSELVGPLGLLGVDARKDERRATAFARFRLRSDEEIRYRLDLGHQDVADLAGMGPSAVHADDETRAARVAALPARVRVTVAVRVSAYSHP